MQRDFDIWKGVTQLLELFAKRLLIRRMEFELRTSSNILRKGKLVGDIWNPWK